MLLRATHEGSVARYPNSSQAASANLKPILPFIQQKHGETMVFLKKQNGVQSQLCEHISCITMGNAFAIVICLCPFPVKWVFSSIKGRAVWAFGVRILLSEKGGRGRTVQAMKPQEEMSCSSR